MRASLARLLPDTAALHPDAPVLRLGDATVTYAELDGAAARMAGFLRARGVEPGDRVALVLPNLPQFAIAYYAILRLGAVVVPMNVLLKRREIRFLLQDAGARVIVALEGLDDHARAAAEDTGATCVSVPFMPFDAMPDAEPVDALVDREASDTAVLLYTSGTTGTPKGAELTHASLDRNSEIAADMFSVAVGDVLFGALPLFHSFGQTCCLNTAVRAAGCLSLLPRFDPREALDQLGAHGVTICLGVPTMYAAMLDHADGPPGPVRFAISGGSAMPVPLLHAVEERFGCPLLEGYGLSETSPVATFNQPGHVRKPGSIGTPLVGVELRVVDDEDREVPAGTVGELLIRGHNVMKGYWRQPEATATTLRGGWMHTGDLGYVDGDGYYFIVDRKKDMIIRGGLNVYPREVEDVLHEHPAVREAAVVPVPHPVLGEEVGAAVRLRDGADAGPRALRGFVREQIAAYKYPRHVWFVDALPLGPTGKVLKREIPVPPEVVAAAAAPRGGRGA